MIVVVIAASCWAALATAAWWSAAGQLCSVNQQVHNERRAANTYKQRWYEAIGAKDYPALRDTLTEAISYLGEAHKHQEEYPNRSLADRDAERHEINRIRRELTEVRDSL